MIVADGTSCGEKKVTLFPHLMRPPESIIARTIAVVLSGSVYTNGGASLGDKRGLERLDRRQRVFAHLWLGGAVAGEVLQQPQALAGRKILPGGPQEISDM